MSAGPPAASMAADRPSGLRASASTTESARPAGSSRSRSISTGTTPMRRPAPARRAAASESDPDLPAAPSTATVGATSRAAYSPTTRSTRAGAPQTSMTMRARRGSRSSGSRAAMLRPKRIAWPAAGTCSERPSQPDSSSVRRSGVSDSETRVATRSPTRRPRGLCGPTASTVPMSMPPGAGDGVLHLAARRDDVEHLGSHGDTVEPGRRSCACPPAAGSSRRRG